VLLEDAGYVSFQQTPRFYEFLAPFKRFHSRRSSFLLSLHIAFAMLHGFLRPARSASFCSGDANAAPSGASAEWWRTFAIGA
jgi:uncharacterized membrane protein (DUF485 family)